MKRSVFFRFFLCIFCFYLSSCYIESGNEISKKLEKSVTNVADKYVINFLSFITNRGKPSIDLFQKRGSNEFVEFCFSLYKVYKPKNKNINVEIINAFYKLKDNETLMFFKEIKKYDSNLYFIMEENKLQKHYISSEEKKLGYIGGYDFFLYFSKPIKARLLDYIEFDIVITDEEGNVYNHHLHYDVSIKPVFKMGSTLWEYWMSI